MFLLQITVLLCLVLWILQRYLSEELMKTIHTNHLINQNDSFNSDIHILHGENKYEKINLWETVKVNKYKNPGNLLNAQKDRDREG